MHEQSLSVREAIIGRRSIKLFNGQPVDREDLLNIIDDAVWAPNHGNREPWRLVMACGSELEKLHELLRDLTLPKVVMYLSSYQKMYVKKSVLKITVQQRALFKICNYLHGIKGLALVGKRLLS